ncbi:hypothetical protein CQA49_08185 [Helicobacter sp. MIT 00-7814]|uniref:hypothetical protein n=1 Tax=unclassified Helicobacter TaxID=2593540 RepID=UPI000E1F938E|nr:MULTISPECIES: hypothetical protein [unclassified Helicobacter]RDU51593.1 hypothetical protein CQA37_09550 [Helicobacter sp. MIT 99-10781]RDU52529.1 hypothetical protein CQA49_08185 [Helicobacter sp. MIT 00-7814]
MKSKLDRILDNLEKAISALIVSFFGLISYLFVNAENLITIKIVVLSIGIAFNVVVLAYLSMLYYRYFNSKDE